MGYSEHYCQGCKNSHDASLWYRREIERDMSHEQQWLCGNKHAELSDQEREQKGWQLFDPL